MLYKIPEKEKTYTDWYNKDIQLSYDDQKFIHENILLEEGCGHQVKDNIGENVNAYESVNGGRKDKRNSGQNLGKLQAIKNLKICNYRTPPKEIALYLETIFGIWQEKPVHWLFIAQHYTPKTINSVINQIIKNFQNGAVPLRVPGAFFTFVIKHKRKRKAFRVTNGTGEQHDLAKKTHI